jgi:hypothetical protein
MGRLSRLTFGEFIDELGNLWNASDGTVYVDEVTEELFAIDGSGNRIPIVDSVVSDDATNVGGSDAIPLPPRTVGRDEMTARLRSILGREPTYEEVDRAMELDRGVTDVAVRTDQPTDVAAQDGGGGNGPTDVAVRNDGRTDVAVRNDAPTDVAVRGADDNIIDADWREIDPAAMSDATRAELSKKGLDWKKIGAAAIIGGVTVYLIDGMMVDSNGNPFSPSGGGGGGGGTNPNGIRPDDDPGGIGDRGRGGGGTTSGGRSTGTSSSGGGGGSSSSGGGYYGSSSSSGGRSGGNYPTLPMTDIRRMILTNISAANGGRPMGGFPTPPGGWDPRMESMFTTGAFEPQQASQEQVDAYNNKPKPSLPTPPWKKQQSQGAPSMPNPVVRNQGVPSYTDMMAKLQGNAASKAKPAPPPAAGTKPSFPSVGMQPNAQQQAAAERGGLITETWGQGDPRNVWNRLTNGAYPAPQAAPSQTPWPATLNGTISFPNSPMQLGTAPTATAKPLTYQEMLAKIQGK